MRAYLRLLKEVAYLIEQDENNLVTRFILIKFFALNNKYLNKKWKKNNI